MLQFHSITRLRLTYYSTDPLKKQEGKQKTRNYFFVEENGKLKINIDNLLDKCYTVKEAIKREFAKQ